MWTAASAPMVIWPFLQRAPARQQLQRLRLRLELALGDGEELAPHVGQRHAGGRPGEKLHAIGLLELPHMVGHGGLGQAQRLRRARESAMHGDGVKGLELGVSHIVPTYMAIRTYDLTDRGQAAIFPRSFREDAPMDKMPHRFDGPPGQEDMPYLLTPGPLTTSRGVKAAMLADWGSRDVEFRRVVAEIRKGLLDLAGCDDEL